MKKLNSFIPEFALKGSVEIQAKQLENELDKNEIEISIGKESFNKEKEGLIYMN